MTHGRRERSLARWDDVHWFLVVLRKGTFTAAARALRTDQSTVSRRIAALEAELGLALFERGRRNLVPTEAAQRLSETAQRIEAEIGHFADDVLGMHSEAVSGRVRLALTEELAISFVIPKVLPKLRAAHPALAVDLVTSYRAADLMSHEADIALRFFQTPRGDLVGRRIARLPTAILSSRRYAKRAAGLGLDELDWIQVELDGLAAVEKTWLESVTRRAPAMICSSYQVQLSAIRSGLGVGIGPAIQTALDKEFVVLDRPGVTPPVLDLYLVTRRSIRGLPRIVAVMDALSDEIGGVNDERG
ncbi:MAG TPA: LysR family transcriptional regulator [Polyangiaceae bacterium]|nr:LysR family transcriptional regulator [Polyangiaceae bacterium]